jgi:hypothetical protein
LMCSGQAYISVAWEYVGQSKAIEVDYVDLNL